MASLFFVALMPFVALVILFGMIGYMRFQPHKPFQYESHKPLSAPEQVLYFRLREALPECVVLAQVSCKKTHPIG